MKVQVMQANLSTSLSLIVFIRLYLIESIGLLLFLAILLVTIGAIIFGLCSLSWKQPLAINRSHQ